MDRSVVKLDALADADGAGAEDDHRLLAALVFCNEFGCLVFLIAAGIEIGGLGVKLGAAGIHHFEGGRQMAG